MGAGGIVQNQAKTLLIAASEPCFFDLLPDSCKQTVNAIDAKPELSRTKEDVMTLLGILGVAVYC